MIGSGVILTSNTSEDGDTSSAPFGVTRASIVHRDSRLETNNPLSAPVIVQYRMERGQSHCQGSQRGQTKSPT
jgi:hypothetical protein